MIAQQTVELITCKIIEVAHTRIVIEVNKNCYLNAIIPHGYRHDMKVGEIVPLLAILRVTRNG